MGPARLAWRQTRGIGASSAGLSASAQYATACGCTPCIDAGTFEMPAPAATRFRWLTLRGTSTTLQG